ncbi:MAG: M48 family metalloprotease [Candidatus Omnitrophica bacterium]|nr:M48 family metalloprotease [Candidatus Omnitrophota bacterium]
MSRTVRIFFPFLCLTVLLMAVGGSQGDLPGMLMGFVLGILLTFIVFRFSADWVLGNLHAQLLPKETAPELYILSNELALEAGIDPPRLYLIPSAALNALSVGRISRRSAILLTRGLLGELSESELKAVLAHEIAHIQSRETFLGTVTASLAGISDYFIMFLRGAFSLGNPQRGGRRDNPIVMLAKAVLYPLTALWIRGLIFPSREYEADRESAMLCGNPEYLMSALVKIDQKKKNLPLREIPYSEAHLFIVNPLREGVGSRIFQSHPLVEKRLVALEGMTHLRPSVYSEEEVSSGKNEKG